MSIDCEKIKGISLGQCLCDLEAPLAVRRFARAVIEDSVNNYFNYRESPKLREDIA